MMQLNDETGERTYKYMYILYSYSWGVRRVASIYITFWVSRIISLPADSWFSSSLSTQIL
jgi:hypothetical protein